MASRDEFLAWHRGQVGYREVPPGSNMTKYAAMAGHANGAFWCATYQVAGMKAVGLSLTPAQSSAYTPTMMSGFQRTSDPQPGDLYFLYYDSLGRVGHVGAFEAWAGGGYFYGYEGNTSAEGSRNGDCVARRKRFNSSKVFFVRVPWEDAVSDRGELGGQGPGVKVLQQLLKDIGHTITVDGDYGPQTATQVSWFQQICGLPITGSWDPVTKDYATQFKAFGRSISQAWAANGGAPALHCAGIPAREFTPQITVGQWRFVCARLLERDDIGDSWVWTEELSRATVELRTALGVESVPTPLEWFWVTEDLRYRANVLSAMGLRAKHWKRG